MYNFIIVDDELLACDALADMLDYSQYHLNCTDTFANSVKALDYLKNHNPDLILCDIKMPVVSGIDIVKFCSENLPDTKIILMSAFRDFEYAQQVIGYNNVIAYILKPLDFDEFSKTIKKASEIISQQNKERKNNDFSVYSQEKMLVSSFFSDYLHGLTTHSELNKQLDNLNIKINICNARCAVVNLHIEDFLHYLVNIWKHGQDRFYDAVRHIIPFKTNDLYIFITSFLLDNIQLILIEDTHETPDFNATVTESISDICKNLSELLKLNINESIIKEYASVSEIKHSEINSTIFITDCIFAIINCMKKNLFDEIQNILDIIFTNTGLSYQQKFLNLLTSELKKHSKSNLTLETKAVDFEDSAVLKEHCIELITQSASSPSTPANSIYKAIKYIDANFAEELTLHSISKQMMMSPSYFSFHFKKVTGESFINYLIKIRIKMAKKYLDNNPNMDINTISEMVGYKSIPYFYKIFKQHTGMSFSEYKRMKLTKNEE